jgi:phage terminase large subunit GpA-like protein
LTKSPYTFISDKIINSFEWVEFKETAQWCKDNIYLSGDVSPYTGMMSFEKTPWIEEILKDWDKPWIEELDCMASTQVGKTTIEFCCIAKELDTDPCMMQLTIPNDNDVSNYVAKKLDPFLKGVKTLQQKLLQRREEEKSRFKKATKEIPGGALFITGNTDTSRRSNSVKRIFLDEVGLFGAGHVSELRGRTKFYEKTGRKILIVSSRKYKGDEIELAYDGAYCKKELQILCKGCGKFFYPTSESFKYLTQKQYKEKYNIQKIENNIEYKREARTTGRVVCECGHETNSRNIEDLVREKNVKLVIVEGSDEEVRHGYKLNALATGLTNYSTIVEELIDAGDDEDALATIYQDYFNETFEKKDKKVENSDIGLLGREEDEFIIPDDTAALYMGIDTQKGYYWATIVAFRYGMSPHIVWAGRVEDEQTIEEFMDRKWYYASGKQYIAGIKRAGQDWQGYRESKEVINDETGEVTYEKVMDMPQRVKEFAFKMADKYGADKDGKERFYATRGEEFLTNDEYFKFANTEVTVSNYKDTRKIKTIKLGTVALKSAFMTTLIRSIQKAKATENDEAYEFENRLFSINKTVCDKLNKREKVSHRDLDMQLTAETYGYQKDAQGKPKKYKSWGKIRNDNHYLDCMVICYMLAFMDNIPSLKKPDPEKQSNVISSIKGIL